MPPAPMVTDTPARVTMEDLLDAPKFFYTAKVLQTTRAQFVAAVVGDGGAQLECGTRARLHASGASACTDISNMRNAW